MAMHLKTATSLGFGTMLLLTALSGCVATSDTDDSNELAETGATSQPIVGGTLASAYPEAALVNMLKDGKLTAVCSGAVIAPKVVLTAGHCVYGFNGWTVQAPFAGGQRASATEAVTYDWQVASEYVDPNYHDIALVFLDRPINLESYPAIAKVPVASGEKIVNVGRIGSGRMSHTSLFVSAPMSVSDGRESGFPFDYAAGEIIESGDSGGPDLLAGSHTIVAVNSGAGAGTEVLARVDLLSGWIHDQIAAHGGEGPVASGDHGGTGEKPEPTPPTGPAEREPNDSYNDANPISGTLQGTLVGGDQDWFTFSLEAGQHYSLSLDATGDAEIRVWKNISGTYYPVVARSSTEVEHTSDSAGRYVVLARSPSGEAQSYALHLTK